ncbi:MAG: SDR family oxidoreductase [Planctomycetota bacterium]
MDITGKRALVTGGARRIGAAITRALSQAGAHVAIHCNRSIDDARELARECPGSLVIEADLADRAAREAIIPETARVLGGLDILVNNASAYDAAPLPELEPDHWDRMLEINLTAPFFLSQQAGLRMKQAGSGVIVQLTDWGVHRPYPNRLAYFASKGGLASVSMGLAAALAPEVRVVAVAPGPILLTEDATPQQEEAIRMATPLGRLGGEKSVADTVLFAVQNDFLTGTTLTVDGGRTLR